jgi:iron complex outermembrane receptor protein
MRKNSKTTWLASALALGLSAPPALAQSADAGASESDEIVVTARKREERIADVPASVTSLGGEQLEELGGLTDIKDLAFLTPGLAFVDTGNINAEVSIRGAGAGTARVTGVDAPIGVLRNGANVSGGNIGGRTYTRADLFDVERVEAIRGPQGALYGVNAVGGVLNVISTRPRPEFGARGSWGFEVATERGELEAILNLPVTDTFALRLGGQVTKNSGGHFQNVVTGEAGDIDEFTTGRVSALWDATPDLSFYLVLDSSNQISSSNRVKTVYELNDPTASPGPADPDGPFLFGHNTPNTVNRDLFNATGEIAWDAPFGRLVAIGSYRIRDTRFLQDEDGTAPGYAQAAFPAAACFTRLCETIFTDETEMSSGEMRYEGQASGALRFMLGVNVQDRTTQFAFIADQRTNNNVATLSATANNATASIEKDTQLGAFGSLSWDVTERLTLDGAVRWSRSDKTGRAYNVRRGSGPLFCPYLDPLHAPLTASCITTPINFDGEFENTAPAISARYSLSDDWNVFASVARGYRAGGFNGAAAAFPTIATPTYDPEETTAYEVGTKFSIGGGLTTITAFSNQFEGLLVSLPIPSNPQQTFRENAGEAETHGVDLEWVGRLDVLPENSGRLDLTLGANWLTGEIDTGPYRGRTVEGSPEYTYTATAIWSKPVFQDWLFQASAAYRGQRGGLTNTTQINNLVPLEDIDLWDARVALQRGPLVFSVAAENLFDETYVALRDPNRSVYGDPREIMFRIALRSGSEAPRRR